MSDFCSGGVSPPWRLEAAATTIIERSEGRSGKFMSKDATGGLSTRAKTFQAGKALLGKPAVAPGETRQVFIERS